MATNREKDLAEAITKAAASLNTAVYEATEAGLRVDLELYERSLGLGRVKMIEARVDKVERLT